MAVKLLLTGCLKKTFFPMAGGHEPTRPRLPVLGVLILAGLWACDSRALGGFEKGAKNDADALASQFAPELGKGVNVTETRTFAKCVVYPAAVEQPVAFRHRDYDEFSVSSRSELNRKMNFSAKVAAKGLWGSGSASFSKMQSLDIKDDNFYWMVNARYELLHESIATNSPQFQLSEHASRLLRDHGWKAFKEACGSGFFVGRTLGAQYTRLYEFTAHDDKFIEQIEASAKVSTDYGIGGESQFSQAIEMAKSSQRLTIHSEIIGGDDSITEKAESPEQLKQELARLRQSLGRRQGEVLEWETLSYDIFDEVRTAQAKEAEVELTSAAADGAIAYYYGKFVDNQAKIARLRKAQQQSQGSEPWYAFTQEQRADIDEKLKALIGQNTEIGQRAELCLAESSPVTCSVKDLVEIQAEIPTPFRDLSGTAPWTITMTPADGQSSFVDFVGFHPQGKFAKRFRTRQLIFNTSLGVWTPVKSTDGRRLPIVLGFPWMRNQADGSGRPYVCIDDFKDICNLRVVEDSSSFGSDGLPEVKLVLTIFNEHGMQAQKYSFYSDS